MTWRRRRLRPEHSLFKRWPRARTSTVCQALCGKPKKHWRVDDFQHGRRRATQHDELQKEGTRVHQTQNKLIGEQVRSVNPRLYVFPQRRRAQVTENQVENQQPEIHRGAKRIHLTHGDVSRLSTDDETQHVSDDEENGQNDGNDDVIHGFTERVDDISLQCGDGANSCVHWIHEKQRQKRRKYKRARRLCVSHAFVEGEIVPDDVRVTWRWLTDPLPWNSVYLNLRRNDSIHLSRKHDNRARSW